MVEWTTPKYSKKQVDWAGNLLARSESMTAEDVKNAVDIVYNFRASHAFPLNIFQKRLRILAHHIDRKSIIAQRLKRYSSILSKLELIKTMKLSEMQDIGGCRAVVHSLKDVNKLVEAFRSSQIKHKFMHQDDYISKPKKSGYRSWHLIYRYYSDKSEVYNGKKIEVQIRTPLQHAWATAVETVDLFTKQALKSSRGKPEWERFFQLMGTEIAFRENTPLVPETPTNIVLLHSELREYEHNLKVISRLQGFADALRVIRRTSAKQNKTSYFLLSLDNTQERLSVTGYKRSEYNKASRAYAYKERQNRKKTGNDAVLVSVGSINNLQRAYPNYYADTRLFVEILKRAIKNTKGSVDRRQLPLF